MMHGRKNIKLPEEKLNQATVSSFQMLSFSSFINIPPLISTYLKWSSLNNRQKICNSSNVLDLCGISDYNSTILMPSRFHALWQ